MKNYSLSTFLLSVLFLGFNSCCSKDDENPCTNFPFLGGEITVNGVVEKLSIAQLSSNLGDSYAMYLFQIVSISSDCKRQNILSLKIDLHSSTELEGTHQIKTFSSANEASGNFTTQQVSPVSQSSFELESGTVKITELGVKKYTIDVNATDVEGGKVSLLLTHQF